jgi:hypothetical protein
MDHDRTQAINAEIREILDQRINILKGNAKLGLMSATDVDDYQRWNLRLRELCQELAKIR